MAHLLVISAAEITDDVFSHVGFCIATATSGDFLQCQIQFAIVLMIAAVDAEDQEAGGQITEQFVVIQHVGFCCCRVVPVIQFTGGASGAWAMVVSGDVDAERD